ncbi:MAG: cytochrome b N-terminal domain-containing protein [Terriglobia bacterium]
MSTQPSLPTPPPAKAKPSARGRLFDWFDQRMGLEKLLHEALDEPIPGGPRFAYVFGSALLAVFLLQILSGVALLFYYTPSVDHAHTSVAYIMKAVTAGSFIRGLHVYGASAMIILLVVHLAQNFFYGSYKGRRELQWISGCILLFLVLGMGFTGYLLPWDEKAYFATKVGANVPSEFPVVGSWIKRLLLRGDHLGALTISSFFVLHVFIISGLIVLFVVLHLFMLRKRGAAGPINEDPFEPKLETELFYPGQVMRDLAFAIIVIVAIALLAHFMPADLGPQANPADTQYLPRPDWYFRFLFQWLKYWPGSRAIIGIGVIPAVLTLLLVALPFIDRRPERRPSRRPVATGIFVVVLLAIITLGALSYYDDSHNPAVASQLASQHKESEEFMRSPFKPDVRGEGPGTSAPVNPLIAQGASIFQAKACFACHGMRGVGTAMAPKLVGISQKYSADQLAYRLQHYSPAMIKGGMPKFQFSDPNLKALVAYLESLK